MKTSSIGLSLLSSAVALADDSSKGFMPLPQAQMPMGLKICTPKSGMLNGECYEDMLYGSATVVPTLQPNVSLIHRTLEESRTLAKADKDMPWTFFPECFPVPDQSDTKYCIFTDQAFANGRGISVLASEEEAKILRKQRAFHAKGIHDDINKYSNPPYEEHEFPGKGRGLIANKTLHPGDRIFASTPIILAAGGAVDLPNAERLALMYRGVAGLPGPAQDTFYKLMTQSDTSDPIEDRVDTNVFGTNVEEIPLSGLFPEIAMLNHDCRPNANYFFDPEEFVHYIHAARTIHPGEEITITYTDNEQPRDTRRSALSYNWGFTCDCSTCTQHQRLVDESDARLASIAELLDQLDTWDPKHEATPEKADLLVSLYTQERFHGGLGNVYRVAAEVYASWGRKYEAIRFARLAISTSMLDVGFNDGWVEDMQAMATAPEKFEHWEERSKRAAEESKKEGTCTCAHKH